MEENIQKGFLSDMEGFYSDKWYLKGNQLFAKQQVVKKRERIAINAREINLGNEKIWVWAAVDLADETVIAVHVSCIKNIGETYKFLKNIAKKCKGTLPRVFVNGEDWNPQAFEGLGFKYTPVAFGTGSMTERFLTMVNCRRGVFLDKFNNKYTSKNMLWWIEGTAGFANYLASRCLSVQKRE